MKPLHDRHVLAAPLLLLALCSTTAHAAAHALPNGGVVGAKKFATADFCTGAVAFSSVAAVVKESKLTFNSALQDKGIGWSRENGEFTCHCPGLYQFAFAASGDADSRLSLKRKEFKSDAWKTVVSTGAGGGTSVALLDMDVGDQVAIFLDAGTLQKEDEATPISSFSGFRIAKKQ